MSMRTEHRVRIAISHLYAAREGAIKACKPLKPGTLIEGDPRRIEALRDENKQRVIILNRMIDALQWVLEEPSELSEWIEQFEKVDRIEAMGYAARAVCTRT